MKYQIDMNINQKEKNRNSHPIVNSYDYLSVQVEYKIEEDVGTELIKYFLKNTDLENMIKEDIKKELLSLEEDHAMNLMKDAFKWRQGKDLKNEIECMHSRYSERHKVYISFVFCLYKPVDSMKQLIEEIDKAEIRFR